MISDPLYWEQRPLSDTMIQYASQDVLILPFAIHQIWTYFDDGARKEAREYSRLYVTQYSSLSDDAVMKRREEQEKREAERKQVEDKAKKEEEASNKEEDKEEKQEEKEGEVESDGRQSSSSSSSSSSTPSTSPSPSSNIATETNSRVKEAGVAALGGDLWYPTYGIPRVSRPFLFLSLLSI